MACRRFGAPERLLHTAGDGDMIVLDQDCVIEAEAAIGAAARPNETAALVMMR